MRLIAIFLGFASISLFSGVSLAQSSDDRDAVLQRFSGRWVPSASKTLYTVGAMRRELFPSDVDRLSEREIKINGLEITVGWFGSNGQQLREEKYFADGRGEEHKYGIAPSYYEIKKSKTKLEKSKIKITYKREYFPITGKLPEHLVKADNPSETEVLEVSKDGNELTITITSYAQVKGLNPNLPPTAEVLDQRKIITQHTYRRK
jgi:hypothetical protein